MKILAVGGTHGNEMLGINLVKSLEGNPIAGVDTLIANPRAVEAKVRFIGTDLNRSFSNGESYEHSLASQIIDKAKDHDIVLDFHNTQTANNNCSFVGVGADALLKKATSFLGLTNCVEATYDCINKACPNVLSIEISVGDLLDSVEIWREKVQRLANTDLERLKLEPVTTYRFLRRVSWDDPVVASGAANDWYPFREVGSHEYRLLNTPNGQSVVPIFIGSRLTEYYATLLTKKL